MPFWDGATVSLLRKAQVVLNTAARWTTGQHRRTRINDLMTATGWLNIAEQIKVTTAVNTWKTIHYHKPLRLRDRYTWTEDHLIQIKRPRLQFADTCLRWRAAQEWNQLPLDLREEPSIGAFKDRMRRLVLDGRNLDPGESEQIPMMD